MANIKMIVKGSKNPSSLYIRLYSGRNLDVNAKTGLLVNPAHWDNAQGNYRNINAVKNRAILRARINKFKAQIVEDYSESYMLGDVIDKSWLEDSCAQFFNRPNQEKNMAIKNHFIYYSDFCDWWLKEKAATWKSDSDKYLGRRVKWQYLAFVKVWREFESSKKYKVWDINTSTLDEFVSYLLEVLEYAPSTTRRMLGRVRFFINRAKDEGIKTDSSCSNNIYVKKIEHDIEEPYLNEQEIQSIYDLDYSNNHRYDCVRDNAIIGCWTGLRISDFNHNLDVSNIKNDLIKIRTKKTKTWVTIPLHPQVKEVLDKRFGSLPARTADRYFNEIIKKICLEAGITKKMNGGVLSVDPETKRRRKKYGVFPKNELISSHVCRRSFATNLYGEVSNSVIMSVAGWKSEDMFLHYIKKTKEEDALELKRHWNQKYNNQLNQN